MKKVIKAPGVSYTFDFVNEYEDKGEIYVIGKFPKCPFDGISNSFFKRFKKSEIEIVKVIKILGFTFSF